MKKYRIIIIVLTVLAYKYSSATIIHIPTDYPTIQQGIDASYERDTVLVQPGEYFENVQIAYKNIVLASHFLTTQDTSYIPLTVIDANFSGIVLFLYNVNNNTSVIGFTLRNGRNETYLNGAGIRCALAGSPLISHNIIEGNYFYNDFNLRRGGGGIACDHSDPIIEYNKIIGNTTYLGWGGGIFCYYSTAIIKNNIISNNTADYGGGIAFEVSEPIILNNLIYDNYADP
ncbi:MAG: right-handed parallel beta-helix repeat-containing protein [Candidatus Zixiibacteriota bacterium]|nr:MAG: right-handed parallel beta-helix repeat-containing protein [candidate division Zixibacteria bacterium]